MKNSTLYTIAGLTLIIGGLLTFMISFFIEWRFLSLGCFFQGMLMVVGGYYIYLNRYEFQVMENDS